MREFQQNRGCLSSVLTVFILISLLLSGIGIGWLIGLSVSPVLSIVITSVVGAAAAVIVSRRDSTNKEKKEEDPKDTKKEEASDKDDILWLMLLKRLISSLALAATIVGIVIGSVLGVKARNENVLGSDISTKVNMWKELGVPEKVIVNRMFEAEYPNHSYPDHLPLQWRLPASSTITTTLSSEIEAWSSLGMPKEVIVQRLFELKYPPISALNTDSEASDNDGESKKSDEPVLYGVQVSKDECIKLIMIEDKDLNAWMQNSTEIGFQTLSEITTNPTILRQVGEKLLCDPG